MKANAGFAPKAVIWDLDGTLLDTGEAHLLSWQETLKLYGVSLSPVDFRAVFGGNNLHSLTQWLGKVPSEAFLAEVADKKEALFRANIRSHTQLFPGALIWLNYFMNAGIPQALASSAPMENIQVSLDTFALWPYLAKVVSGEKLPSKPNPATFLEAALQLDIQPNNCLVMEDSEPGLLGAQRAGMQVFCKLGTVKKAPAYALAAFEEFPANPEEFMAGLSEKLRA